MTILHLTLKCRVCSFPYFSPNQCNEFLKVYYCTSSKNDKKGTESNNVKLPEEPQHCCMSGCANCVWVKYAEELSKILDDGGETAKQKIMEHVKDPNLRTFIMLELSHLFKKKKIS